MNKLLQALGLMRVSEHDDKIALATRFEQERQSILSREVEEQRAKFKKAITDLAAEREEIAVLKEAEAMLRKRERDRNRRKGKV